MKSLLEIVFINLFKNAAIYTDNDFVNMTIEESLDTLSVNLLSFESTISAVEQKHLFDSFMRGSNSQQTSGSGLVLKIIKRILEYHKATINYQSASTNQNIFTINFLL